MEIPFDVPSLENAHVRFVSPLGTRLLFHHMAGEEYLGRLFKYELTLLSKDGNLVLSDLLGHPVTVELDLPVATLAPNAGVRFFSGYVTSFSRQGVSGNYHVYSATVRPWLWLLSQSSNCRIFPEGRTIPEIIKSVFEAYEFANVKDSLIADYPPREFVVQYTETDFNFVSRLMEEHGIYYFFTHEAGKHTLVLADHQGAHTEVAGYESVPFLRPGSMQQALPDHIDDWETGKQIQPGTVVLKDFNFKNPKADLLVRRSAPNPHEMAKFEHYDYPGNYQDRNVGEKIRAPLRLEELDLRYEESRGAGNARGLTNGCVFTLKDHPLGSENREYLITGTAFSIEGPRYESQGDSGSIDAFYCNLSARDSHRPFRSEATTLRPTIAGPQTATVVGDSGEDITTDEYGRVKVKFHWDRRGETPENGDGSAGTQPKPKDKDKNGNDPNSSCWVRVAQMWAGANFGAINIPRIGDEVIVDFLEGDPDRPIITGRVYNADNMPPYALPDHKTQTGIKSRSSKGGNPQNFNELRFEDLKGDEEVYLQAEKDLNILVKNDETRDVGHDRVKNVKNDETSTITGNRSEDVGKDEKIAIHGNRSETVDKDETITITGARSESVGKDETISITGKRTETVGKDENISITGARQVDVGKADTLSVGAGRTQNITGDDQVTVTKKLHFDAGDEIVIKTGDASITMKKDGTIILKGKDVSITASGKINANASGDVIIKGSKVSTN
jgi:type VI secretion system secreted protein VgrG